MEKGDVRSQRLLRKGALVEATYVLFQEWDARDSLPMNLEKVLPGAISNTRLGIRSCGYIAAKISTYRRCTAANYRSAVWPAIG